jgi:glutamyl-Q tRNA(Asp) synthetase
MTITRFAPSPTGKLHLGHAYSALFAYEAAKRSGGKFLFRIEDIDASRCRPEFVAGIIEDLRWLGVDWEGPVRVQSEHMNDYLSALSRLDEMGLLYPCFCTRGEVAAEAAAVGNAPHGLGAVYAGTCKNLSASEREDKMRERSFVLRLDTEKAGSMAGKLSWRDAGRGEICANPQIFGDVVLARKDVKTSYHLSVAVDDALQGITLVTRGEDLFESTHVHRLLQALLGYETPEYHHHKLLLDAAGKRYAKRDNSVTLRHLREIGKSPDEVRMMAGL